MVNLSSINTTALISVAGIVLAIFVGTTIIDSLEFDLTSSTSASIDLTPNSDIVAVSGYSAFTDPNSTGFNTSGGERRFIAYEHDSRVRQLGTAEGIKIMTGANIGDASLSSVIVEVWRQDGATFDRVGASNNILSDLQTAGADTDVIVTFSSPITGVQEGDYVTLAVTVTAGSVNDFIAKSTGTNVVAGRFADGAIATTDYDWDAAADTGNKYLRAQLRMQAPSIVFIGDSITAGHNVHDSYVETDTADSHTSATPYKVGNALGVSIQNVGIGGGPNQAQDGLARFTEDVVDLKPKMVVIGYGTSEVENGRAEALFEADMQAMIDEAQTAGIEVIIMEVYPRDYDTIGVVDAKDTNRLSFNTAIQDLATTNEITAVSTDTEVGDGMSPMGIDALYDSGDNIHFNAGGYTQIATKVTSVINSLGTTSTTSTALSNAADDAVLFAAAVYAMGGILIILFVVPMIRGFLQKA